MSLCKYSSLFLSFFFCLYVLRLDIAPFFFFFFFLFSSLFSLFSFLFFFLLPPCPIFFLAGSRRAQAPLDAEPRWCPHALSATSAPIFTSTRSSSAQTTKRKIKNKIYIFFQPHLLVFSPSVECMLSFHLSALKDNKNKNLEHFEMTWEPEADRSVPSTRAANSDNIAL